MCRGQLSNHGGVCSNCWPALSFIEAPLCDRLGVPFAYDPGAGIVSPGALARPPAWNRARGAVRFDQNSRKLVHALKYRDRHETATLLASLMLRAGSSLLADADLLIPVPLYRSRLWRRRFNQSALLGANIQNYTGVPMRTDLLRRDRPTRAQVGLDYATRRKNVRNAFSVTEEQRPDLFAKHCVLLDDVLTTGATAEACSKTLLKAGAARVDVIVFALVLNPSQSHMSAYREV